MIGLTVDEVLRIHREVIVLFGGTHGVRDSNGLESAIHRPTSGFTGAEFYKTPAEKASAIMESILNNHPFLDGNKRTGYILMRLTLLHYGFDIEATQEEKYQFVVSVASGEKGYDQILKWINSKMIRL